jgi:hypothetical protein
MENAVYHDTRFFDEAYFHFGGAVYRQNMRFWAREHLHNSHGRSRHGMKVAVLAAISSHVLIQSLFFKETANS